MTASASGSVTFAGHSGMMRVVIADPWLFVGATGGELSIADPDDPTARLPFARIASFDTEADGMLRARGTTLTADGSDLFFGPYAQGTPFDDPVVTA